MRQGVFFFFFWVVEWMSDVVCVARVACGCITCSTPQGQEQTKFVFQGVHETICFGPAAEGWREGETPMNQIVFIGRNLSRTGLMEGFRSCIWIPLPDDWQEFFDKRTGQPYYVNSKTKQKSWERPVAGNAAVVRTVVWYSAVVR